MPFIIKGQNQSATVYFGVGTKHNPIFFVYNKNRAKKFHYYEGAERFFYKHDMSLWNDYEFSIVNTATNEEKIIPITKPEEVVYLEDIGSEDGIRHKY